MQKALQTISLSCIDKRRSPFTFSVEEDNPVLQASIKQHGVLQPIIVQAKKRCKQQGYRLVCGYKRVKAARALGKKTIPAYVLEGTYSDYDCFLLNVADNNASRELHFVEKGTIVFRLISDFGCRQEEVIKTILPLLSLNPHCTTLSYYCMVGGLPIRLKKQIMANKISLEQVLPFHIFKLPVQTDLLLRSLELSLSVNKAKAFAELCQEISLREKQDPRTVITEIIHTEHYRKLQGKDRGAFVLQALYERRNPYLTQKKKEIEKAVKELKLPPQATLSVPASLEGTTFSLTLKLSREEDLGEIILYLNSLQANQALKKLFSLCALT